MTLFLRLFVLWLILLVAGTTVAQAQTISIRPLSTTSVCAGSPFSFVADVLFTAPNGSLLTDLYLYNNAYADSVKLDYTYVYSPSLGRYAFTLATSIPQNRLTSAYYLRFGLLYNGRYVYSSQKSDLLRVNALPPSPTVRDIAACQNTTAPPITSVVTASGPLKWCNSLTSTPAIASPTIATSIAGPQSYYVSQSDGNACESIRAAVNATINPQPLRPSVTPLNICQNATPPSITSVVTNYEGMLKWYSPTSMSLAAAPVLSSSTVGTTYYGVTQTNQYSCESMPASITYTVKSLPVAPTVSPNPVVLCQGSVPGSLSATATGMLNWYDPGNNVFSSITPSTNTVGNTVYRVTQTVNSCESSPTSLTVIVIPRPNAPVVLPPTPYCQGVTATPLSATPQPDNILRWYNSGGTISPVSPVPSTQNPGTTLYYVSQVNGNGCESERASIAVTVNAVPTVTLTNDGPLTATKNSVLLTASGASSYSFSTGATPINGGNTATVSKPGLYSVTATGNNGCSALATTSVATGFDLTAITYVRPSTIYKTDVFTVVVDVLELQDVASSGPVVVKISKDAVINLSFSSATTLLNSHAVQNGQWSFDATTDESYYVLSTNSVINSGGQLSFGLTGQLLPGATSGVLVVSTVLISSGGREYKLSNNTDADKVDYFQ